MFRTTDNNAVTAKDIGSIRIKELNGRISELEKKILADTAIIEEESRKSEDNYNPAISGARHRISQNRNMLERCRKELRKISKRFPDGRDIN